MIFKQKEDNIYLLNKINKTSVLKNEEAIFSYLNEDIYYFNYKKFIDTMLESIFLFEKTLKNFSIENKKYKICYTKKNYNDDWSIFIYQGIKEITDIKIIEKYKINTSALEIFKKHLYKLKLLSKDEDSFSFREIEKNISSFMKKKYGKEYLEILGLLFLQYLEEFNYINIEKSTLKNIKTLNSSNYTELQKWIFDNTLFFKDWTNIETFMKEDMLEKVFNTNINVLKKQESLFENKNPMGGLYFYKFLVNFLRELNKDSIPKKILKKRGRKPKQKIEEEEEDEE